MRHAALLLTLSFAPPLLSCSSRSVPSPAPVPTSPAGPVARDELTNLQEACAAGEGRSCTALGRAWDEGLGTVDDDARAVELYRLGCDLGDLAGCNDLGEMLRDGAGVAGDEPAARALFDTTCRADHLPACTNLAVLVREGRGGPADPLAAAALLTRACDGDHAGACVELGKLERACELDAAECTHLGYQLEKGEGRTRDRELAAEVYSKACSAGDQMACNNLASLLQNGTGVVKDVPRAAALYETACYGGTLLACRNLGWLHEEGEVENASLRTSVRLYDKACTGGEAAGCSYLGDLYQKGTGVRTDAPLAARYYKLGCKHGHAWGCNALAWLYAKGEGVPQDWLRAMELHEEACNGEHWRGCSNLGYMFQEGQGVAKDLVEAEKWYRKSCGHDDGEGCHNLGNLYYDGWNGEVDEQEAATLYQKSCDLDNATGCSSLGFLYRHGYGVRFDEQHASLLYQRACSLDQSTCDYYEAAPARVPPAGWRWDVFDGKCQAPSMIKVPAGRFSMGSRPTEGQDDERPAHPVDLSAYSIAKTEVTVCQYAECVKAGKCTAPMPERSWWGRAALMPVTGVTWEQARDYCAWKGWRLPTEAEWERAARGTDGRMYPWGDEEPTCDRADWDPNGDVPPDACAGDGPSLVGSFPTGASAVGALDMSGNVREWTADWFGPYPDAELKDPTGPARGTSRALRGGGWSNTEFKWLSSAVRFRLAPMNGHESVGFRCATGGPKRK